MIKFQLELSYPGKKCKSLSSSKSLHLKFRRPDMTLGPSCPHTLDLRLALDAPNVPVQARLSSFCWILPLQSAPGSEGDAVSVHMRAHPGAHAGRPTCTRSRMTRFSCMKFQPKQFFVRHWSLLRDWPMLIILLLNNNKSNGSHLPCISSASTGCNASAAKLMWQDFSCMVCFSARAWLPDCTFP